MGYLWGSHIAASRKKPQAQEEILQSQVEKPQPREEKPQPLEEKPLGRIKEVLGDDFFLTEHDELSPKCLDKRKTRKLGDIGSHIKSWGMNIRHPGQSGRSTRYG